MVPGLNNCQFLRPFTSLCKLQSRPRLAWPDERLTGVLAQRVCSQPAGDRARKSEASVWSMWGLLSLQELAGGIRPKVHRCKSQLSLFQKPSGGEAYRGPFGFRGHGARGFCPSYASRCSYCLLPV